MEAIEKKEIGMGEILDPAYFTLENLCRTKPDYRISESTLMNGIFTGSPRSGKTVAAMRFIKELSEVKRSKTGKRLRFVILDSQRDWRIFARFVEPERFKFNSLGNVDFSPMRINPWKIPKGIKPQPWIDGVIDIYCRAYDLLERGRQMLSDVVYELYDESGVMAVCEKDNWMETVPYLSRYVNFNSIYKRMSDKKEELKAKNDNGIYNDTVDAYTRILNRLQCFNRGSIEEKLFGTSDGIGIDGLIGDDDFTVLESEGLENTFKNFIFGVITFGIYKFALAHEDGYLAYDQYETVLVIEEADEILSGTSCAAFPEYKMSGKTVFEQMLDESDKYGLSIIAITRKISDISSSIIESIANSGMIYAGRLKRPEDIKVVLHAMGEDSRIKDRNLEKWFPHCLTGWFVFYTSETSVLKDTNPILIKISRIMTEYPFNRELDEILNQKETIQH